MSKRAGKIKAYIFLFFIIYLAISLTKGCMHNKQILRKYDDLKIEYAKDQKLNKELKLKMEQVQSDSFIELTARKKLGLVKPGEVVYKIIEE